MNSSRNILHRLACLMVYVAVLSGCDKKPDPGTGTEEPEFSRYTQDIPYENTAKVYKSTYSILLPEGYGQDLDKRYPVVYMLHGFGESGKDWSSWVNTIQSMEGNGLQQMIYVFPNCNDSYYCNYYDGKAMYMDMIVNELVPLIDRTYRTIDDRKHRAVMGYSMGGFGAMVLPLKNPDVFSISVPLSMSFRTDEQYMTESQSGWDSQWGKIFGGRGKSGEERLTDYYKEHCPFYQFIPENMQVLSQIRWFFHCGDDEEQLLIANDNLHVQLRDYGYDHEFRISDGGHTGDYWRTAARETLPWIQHVMNGGGEWTRIMKDVTIKTAELNDDGSSASDKFKENPQDGGLAIYFAHKGFNEELVKNAVGMLSQTGHVFPYMILPCDLDVKPLEDWMEDYTGKYGIGGSPEKSHVIAFGDAGAEAYSLAEQFNACYYIDADLTDEEESISADAGKRYYIDQTDNGTNYKDMNALYIACKAAGADFEYRMRNGIPDKEKEILLAVQSIVSELKYK